MIDDRVSGPTRERERIHALTERVHFATGCSNLIELALAPGRLGAAVGAEDARDDVRDGAT